MYTFEEYGAFKGLDTFRRFSDIGTIVTTVKPRYNDSICSKDVAIKMNLLLHRILNEQIDM